MNKLSITLPFLCCIFSVAVSQQRVPVFVSGTEGHKSYRIPAMISLPDGVLLAFCEGRVADSGDFGDINIVLKRSNDRGITWSALQTVGGKYAGRIFVAANHSEGEPLGQFMDYRAHGYYTDDHGKTFHLSQSINIPGSNESMATELSDGRLMMNVRNQRGDIRSRIIAISRTGGEQWDTAYFDNDLPDPICQGSILTVSNQRKSTTIAFCNAADRERRDNLTLRISSNEGKSWDKKYVIDKAGDNQKGDYAAYSDLVKLSRKSMGILYERNNYSEITFVRQDWKK